MNALRYDLRYALRTLARTPGLSAVMILSLAIGIGANTAVFSVVNALLLKPLPYPSPARLAILWLRAPGVNITIDWPSPGQYHAVETQNQSFDKMSISRGDMATLSGLAQPEQVEILRTSSSLFELLGAKPLHGRLLQPEDDVPGKAPVAVLSFNLWQRLYSSDPNIIGKSVTLDAVDTGTGAERKRYTIVGVLTREFLLNDEIMPTVVSNRNLDLFLPLPLDAAAINRPNDENYNVMARLKPGVTITQAQADVAVIASRIREKDHRDNTFTIGVVSLLDQVVGDVRRGLLVLLGSVALVLLIACANVANLLLARANGRRKEVAIRTALGAGWHRLVRQLLTESLLLSLAGGAAGLLLAKLSLNVVRTINPGNIPRIDVIGIDTAVLAFTFGVAILTGIAFGLAPALRSTTINLNSALKAGGRNTQGDGGFRFSRHRLRNLLVGSELAFSLILLIAAGLLIRSFVRLESVSPGFNPANTISMRIGASARELKDRDAAVQFYEQLGAQVAATPGVTSQGATSVLPFTSAASWGPINVEGFTPEPGHELQVDVRTATGGYFPAMGISLVKGRVFSDDDVMTKAPLVILVDERFAQRYWPGQDPIGKQVWNNPTRKRTVVGVVGNVKQYGLDIDGRPAVYYPGAPGAALYPRPSGGYMVARTTSSSPAAIIAAIHAFDPTLPVYDIRTMDDRMSASLARQRFSTLMLGAFALFALILASVGVYGVMSYLVTQGMHDIGVRIALGAPQRQILRLVVGQGMTIAAAGIIAGLLGAAALTRLMSNLLFGISATDLATFVIVPLILAVVAFASTYLPARRATQIDPLLALRAE